MPAILPEVFVASKQLVFIGMNGDLSPTNGHKENQDNFQ
jgi:hypothetical protein